MFSRVLIANRGEIAVRIIRTCRELGIETVAVYSEADHAALHVRTADAAFAIGAAPARESYLHGPAILNAAEASGAEAIHPGYGFLAESASFAAAVAAMDLTWIGPPASVISLLGDKVAAKRAAVRAGVPVVPGYADSDMSYERLRHEAEQIGYPIMLKASAGGGGKGMRVVDDESGLRDSIEAARREAEAAFADDRIFLEKLLTRPRHVEVQIMADIEGAVVFLGERDCSLQRRHQKVVEEAPSPAVSDALRAEMGRAAVRVARESGYVNAGTVEFLVDGESYYFLEVNTRIQVEHPVTEAIYGVDLVRLQLEIAAGRPLEMTQDQLEPRGHAIEGRLYAENPENNFLPSTGLLRAFVPPQGPGIRNDVGAEPGDTITTYYDPMVAKLIVHAETRALAVARFQQALDRYVCVGPTTNLHFLNWIVHRPEFVSGTTDVGFIERAWAPRERVAPPIQVLAAAALSDANGSVTAEDPWREKSAWRASGVPQRYQYQREDELFDLTLTSLGNNHWRVIVGGADLELSLIEVKPGAVTFQHGHTVTRVVVDDHTNGYTVFYHGTKYELRNPGPSDYAAPGTVRHIVDSNLSAPMPGTIVSIRVAEGQSVEPGEPLVIMEAMKMEHVVESVIAGTVTAILVHPGDMVSTGTVLVRMDA